MTASDTDNYNNVPVEATSVFGAATVFILVLLIFFLYLNQKWCLINFGNLPFICCNEPVNKSSRTREIGGRIMSGVYSIFLHCFNRLWRSCLNSRPVSTVALGNNSVREGTFASTQNGKNHDLISLAEKGKVGGGSGASSNCSTASCDDEPRKEKALRHRDSRGSGSSHSRKLALQLSIDDMNEEVVIPPNRGRELKPMDLDIIEPATITKTTPEEKIFDVTDMHSNYSERERHHSVPKCGSIEVAFAYDAPMRKMTVHILQGRDIPAKERGGATHTQVRLVLLPGKKQKHKSKIRTGDNPQFMESFLLHRVNPEDVNSMGARFRLYSCERMRRERMIGECVVSFAALNLELETTTWLALEPRANISLESSAVDLMSLSRSDSTGSTHSMQHGGVPELLIGLAYNGTTGRLTVEVVKGSHFSLCAIYRNLTVLKAPDTYVKLILVSSTGHEMARCKTSVRRSQPNPLFKEMFMFQVALFQLQDVTLMVSVYMKKSMKRKEMMGWFTLGLNSSGEEELAHWNDMRDCHGEQVCRWHVLVDS